MSEDQFAKLFKYMQKDFTDVDKRFDWIDMIFIHLINIWYLLKLKYPR